MAIFHSNADAGGGWRRYIDIDFTSEPNQDLRNGGVGARHTIAGLTDVFLTGDPSASSELAVVNGVGLRIVSTGTYPGVYIDMVNLISGFNPLTTGPVRVITKQAGAFATDGQYLYCGGYDKLVSASLPTTFSSYMQSLMYVYSASGVCRYRKHSPVYDGPITGSTDRSHPGTLAWQITGHMVTGYESVSYDWSNGIPALSDLTCRGWNVPTVSENLGNPYADTTYRYIIRFAGAHQGNFTSICERLVLDVLEA